MKETSLTPQEVDKLIVERDIYAERYRAMIRAMPDTVHLLDETGRILESHVGSAPSPHMPASGYEGKFLTEVFPPSVAAEMLHLIQETFKTGAVQEWEYTLPEYVDTHFEARVFNVFVRPAAVREVMIIIRDVTRRKHTEEHLEALVNARTAELMSANETLQQFAYTASHDLREPLNKIISFGERLGLKYGDKLDENGRQYLEVMRSAALRMRTLVDDILTYARSNKENGPPSLCDLGTLAAEAVSDLEVSISEAHASIELTQLPIVEGYPQKLRQLFQNLISNAIKFRRPDVPCLVQVTGSVVNGDAILQVLDNGIGFDTKFRDKIFQAFTRLHTRFEYPGTGIGLALCNRIVSLHKGTIEADSVPGVGSTFTIRLPIIGGACGH